MHPLTPVLPSLNAYQVDTKLGFLPPQPPLTSLPAVYSAWDDLSSHLPQLISLGKLRAKVDHLLLLSTRDLQTIPQLRRAFVVLGYLIHGYIWCSGGDSPEPDIPPALAEPYLSVCSKLDMQPTLAYAGLCLWNWKPGDQFDLSSPPPTWHPSKFDCHVSFTGTRDDAIFYLIPILVEAQGGHLPHLLLSALSNSTTSSLITALEKASTSLHAMASLIKHLHALCSPQIFYHKFRPFLAGGNGMESKGMPDGVRFHLSDGTIKSYKCVGGSAAQSSLFPFLDAALGISHHPLPGARKGEETVFYEMRAYMPPRHRELLDKLEAPKMPNIRKLVEQHNDADLTNAYSSALTALAAFRSKHIGVVTTHIISSARAEVQRQKQMEDTHTARVPDREEVHDGLSVQDEGSLQGTGGSALMQFLKGAREDTVGAAVR